jgi:hypothetical protein
MKAGVVEDDDGVGAGGRVRTWSDPAGSPGSWLCRDLPLGEEFSWLIANRVRPFVSDNGGLISRRRMGEALSRSGGARAF